MRLITRIVTGLSIVLFLTCCGVWLLLSAPRAGFEALTIPTGSMRPNMPAGSLALVRQVPASSLHVGDIVTYVDPFNAHKTITHRIVKTYMIAGEVPGFMTKGDANTAPDLPVPAGSMRGKVIWHAPHAGFALSWVRSWAGIAVLVYLPALLIIIEEIKRLRDYFRQSLPYRLAGYRREVRRPLLVPKLAAAPLAGVGLVGMFAWQPLAVALSTSDITALAENHISIAAVPLSSSCHDDTNVAINSTTSQTTTSGSASNNGTTNNPETVSGSVNNASSTNIDVSVGNGC